MKWDDRVKFVGSFSLSGVHVEYLILGPADWEGTYEVSCHWVTICADAPTQHYCFIPLWLKMIASFCNQSGVIITGGGRDKDQLGNGSASAFLLSNPQKVRHLMCINRLMTA